MTTDDIIKLAREVVLFVTPGYEGTLQVTGSFAGLERFAHLVRAAAFDEAKEVLEFHGFDDAVPYLNWAKVNQKDKP